MALTVELFSCKAAHPMAGNATPTRFRGEEVQIPDQGSLCLGGFLSQGLLNQRDLSLVMSIAPPTIPWPDIFGLYRLFRDITAAEALAGITLYRGFFLSPTTACSNLQVYVNGGPTVGAVTLALDTVATSGGNPYVQRIANETTAPTGPTFAAYTSGSPLTIGPMAVGDVKFLWVKLTLGPASSAKAYDAFNLTFVEGGSTDVPHFYHTVQAGLSSATVAGTLDGQPVIFPYGETYSLTILNSSGAAIDPPSSTVMVYSAASFEDQAYRQGNYGMRVSGTYIGQASKVATGLYQYQFKPPAAGHYSLTFDLGGEYQIARSVEVTPVA